MESLGGFRDRFLVLRRFGQSFVSLPIQGYFRSSPVQIFRQSNLNSKLNFDQIPVVISKLSIYDYIYTFINIQAYFIYISVKLIDKRKRQNLCHI